ncbi:hypothetical protein BKA70DRAFT_1286709 [Coprinopsis sp. MPI-PUGE-AT-0042]|nr:hypothetical protein BKA70DRAFT_1286709 [Coprinopsis sp. MPI-PUGE-AT-0042]
MRCISEKASCITLETLEGFAARLRPKHQYTPHHRIIRGVGRKRRYRGRTRGRTKTGEIPFGRATFFTSIKPFRDSSPSSFKTIAGGLPCEFPHSDLVSLKSLFLSRHFATCPASWGDASIIHLPMLKRLTVEIEPIRALCTTSSPSYLPGSQVFHLIGRYYGMEYLCEPSLRKSQADRVALRISEAPIEPLLTELLSTSIPIYQLDVQEIGWLNPTFCALRSEASIPPPTHDPSSIPQKPSWAADDASSPSRSGAAHTQRAEASAAGSTIQHIRYAWKTATVELSCHCQSPALCHEYEKLCLG